MMTDDRNEKRLRAIVKRKDRLLVAYRTGGSPTDALLDQLAADRAWLYVYDQQRA